MRVSQERAAGEMETVQEAIERMSQEIDRLTRTIEKVVEVIGLENAMVR